MTAPIQFDNVPLEVMAQHESQAAITANNVFQCATQTQNHVYTLHGPGSEHESKESFPHVNNNHLGHDCYVPTGEVVHLHPPIRGMSIVFSGLSNNTIIIHAKVNHILIRRSSDVNIDIKEGTVSGIDIIHCRRILVKMPYHNFTNLEYGENIHFQAQISNISQLHITGSLDVKINGNSVPINPFINAIFCENGWFYKKQSEIPRLMICKY